jgi:hypothetical protein
VRDDFDFVFKEKKRLLRLDFKAQIDLAALSLRNLVVLVLWLVQIKDVVHVDLPARVAGDVAEVARQRTFDSPLVVPVEPRVLRVSYNDLVTFSVAEDH